MKTLTIDIECAPNLAQVWALFKQNISLAQLQESAYMLSFAAKWEHKRTTMFWSVNDPDMHQAAHDLLDEADTVVTYNGDGYDIPHLNRELLLHNLGQPSPFRSVDLLKVVRKNFRFASNKLDFVSQQLGCGAKMKHEGHELWVKCMAGDEAAWKRMEAYNRRDTLVTERVFNKLRPWIRNINMPLIDGYGDTLACPNCGGGNFEKRGLAATLVSTYQQYHCLNKSCGRWWRGARRVGTTLSR